MLITVIQVCLIINMFIIGFCQLAKEFKDGFLIDLIRAVVCILLIVTAYFAPTLQSEPYPILFAVFMSVLLSTTFIVNWISKEYVRRTIRIKNKKRGIK